ncbi:MAG: hypothetical protein ACRD0D_14890 [Acidimicrobiales bacterium]
MPTPGGPVSAAERWVEAVMEERDWGAAWKLTDPVLRKAQAQAWLWANRGDPEVEGEDLDELVETLCHDEPWHPLWDAFAEAELDAHQRAWVEFDLDRWQVLERPEVIGPDLEVVVFVRHASSPLLATDPSLVVARPFLMRFVGTGWRVVHAGSDKLPVPGWPPRFPAAGED